MSSTTPKPRHRRAGIVAILSLVTALAVAATAFAGSSATPLEQAKVALKAALKKPTRLGFPQHTKPIPTGKSVVYIHCGVPACSILAEGASKAAKVLGWKYTTLSTDGTPESVLNAWKTAVRMKVDAVLSSGYDRVLFEKELQQLKQRNVAVVNYATLDKAGNGITLVIGGREDIKPEGIQMAAKVTVDTAGKANVLLVDLPSFTILQPVGQVFKQKMAQWCPGCPVATMAMPVTALGKDAPDRVVSYLRSHPKVNYVVYSYDGVSVGLPAALKAVGLEKKVKFVGASGTVENLGYIQRGEQAATVSQGYYEVMAIMMDAAARHINGESVKPDQLPVPYFLVTKQTLTNATGFGPVVPDLYGKLKKIWLKTGGN
jgi:ribose transport system substrate-binding protein